MSVLFAPKAKKEVEGAQRPSAFMMRWMGVGGCHAFVCERERQLKAVGEFEKRQS